VVVPFNAWNDWVMECLQGLRRQTVPDFDVWLAPDALPPEPYRARLDAMGWGPRLHVEPTGPGNPSRKRNAALARSASPVAALVDSDAWPREDWLEKAVALLDDETAVVTGPNLTPPGDEWPRRVAGRVMESPLGFGGGYIRHVPAPRQVVREMPTCNMVLRRLEGLLFREDLDTGEDMMYCSDVRARGKRVLYDPEVVVFHHRRRLFRPFMRQFYAYGFHKGRLARAGSDITYLWQAFPALLVLYLAGWAVSLLLPLPPALRWLAAAPGLLYAVAILAESLRRGRCAAERMAAPAAFAAAHAAYGTGYLAGLLSRR